MTTLVRAGWANWTVLAAGISLAGFACSPSPVPPAQTGGSSGVGGNPLPGTGGTIGGVGGAPATGGSPTGTGGGSGGSGGSGPSTGGDAATGGGVSTGGSATGGSGSGLSFESYNPDFKEFVGEDCELPDSELLSPASHELPDPFLKPDGSRISSMSEWACQRAWLKKNIESHVYGEKHGKPASVTGTVSSTSINVQIEGGATYTVSVSLPPGASGPVPGMFRAENSGVPINFLHDEGVAVLNYTHASAESAFNTVNGSAGSDPIKWAWAVSRAIDVLVDQAAAGQNDIIDPKALGTTGCSFAGKSAFVVGAFDERIALGIPQESGSGGLASYRVIGDGDLGPNVSGENDPEAVSAVCSQGWFSGTVCNGNVDSVPADAHFMVAMYAPRGFTTLDNNRIGHLSPVAQYTAAAAGAEVFKAFGLESNVGYHGGNDDDPHEHCQFYPSQEDTARKAIRGFLTKTEPPANFMEPKLKNEKDEPVDWALEDYIGWDTPALAP